MTNRQMDFRRAKAIEKTNMNRILAVNPHITNNSGIYFLTRADEDGINYFYIGQSVHCLQRLASHLIGYQHIDLSLKKRGLYSPESNPFGWNVNMIEYPQNELDKWEQYWILMYTKKGYQCRYNKTAGGQGEGKEQINEYRPARGYRDGLEQGRKNASKEISALFEKYLTVSIKNPGRYADAALKKFKDFLDFYKGGD